MSCCVKPILPSSTVHKWASVIVDARKIAEQTYSRTNLLVVILQVLQRHGRRSEAGIECLQREHVVPAETAPE